MDLTADTGTVVQIGTLEIHLPARVRPRPAELPGRVFGFTGRTAEVARLARLSTAGIAAVQVSGRPGSGKTALAVEVAHALAGRYPDGQIALHLHGYDGLRPPSPYELLGRMLRSLDVPDHEIPPDRAGRLVTYRRCLRERQVLVLADDASTSAQVAALVPPPGGSFMLITTRRALPGLGPDVARLRVGELDAAAALALLGTGEAAGLDAIARMCGGLPLALRIVAARLELEPELGVDRLARLLADSTTRLGELVAGDRAVRASFRLSYQRLDPAARLVFRRCAALPLADLTAPAAAALAGAPAGQALADLAAAHLLDDGGNGRYRFHDLLRLYAVERLHADDPPGAADAARRRLGDHHLDALRRARAALDAGGSRSWFREEWDNTVAVADHLATTDPDALQELADLVVSIRDVHTPWDGWHHIQQTALGSALEDSRAADLQVRLAIAYRERHLLDRALDVLAGAGERFRRAGSTAGAALVAHSEGEIHRDRRAHDLAAQRFTAAIALLLGDPSRDGVEALAWARHGLGDVRTSQDRPVEALRLHRQALRAFDGLGNTFGRAWAWHGIGDALGARGRRPAAIGAYRRALAAHAELGNVASAGWSEQCLAETLLAAGQPAEAADRFERARAAAVTRVDRWSQARALLGLGDVAGDARLWRAALDVLGDLDGVLHAQLHERLGTSGPAAGSHR